MKRISGLACAGLLACLLGTAPVAVAQDYAAGDSIANWDEGQNSTGSPNGVRTKAKEEFNPYVAAAVFGGIILMGVIYVVTRPKSAAPPTKLNY